MVDRLGPGILSGPIDRPAPRPGEFPPVRATTGLIATDFGSRFTGVVVKVSEAGVVLRSRGGEIERFFAYRVGGFLVGGQTVTLVAPQGPATSQAGRRTASGSIAVAGGRAKVARASRILVEGVHDAELVEKVWGDDLREVGIVVERLDGIDVLAEFVADFRPSADARLGVLVDHLVPGSKESRIASSVAGPHLLVVGTPYVDVWQAIRPSTLGRSDWPVIPPGRSWKEGICEAFGEPSPGRLWKRLLSRVTSYADLEPALVGAVESLIDFVTSGDPAP